MARVALVGENSIEFVSMLINIWNQGDCAVIIDWRIPDSIREALLKEANVKQCYIEEKYYVCKGNCYEDGVDIDYITYTVMDATPQMLPQEIRKKFSPNYSDHEALILYSSGTTGKAKGVILSHYAINTNADAILKYMLLDKDDCIYIVKSLAHSSTITGELLTGLKSNANILIGTTILIPRMVFRNINKYNVTTLCINPTILQMYIDEIKNKGGTFTKLRKIYVSGAQLYEKTYFEAHEYLKNIEVYNVYGLTEAGPRVSAQTKECCSSNSVGKPLSGIEICIVDDTGMQVGVEERGIIHVKTPSKFNGYISGKSKHVSLHKDWLNTGDIGYLDKSGELHIVNRADDMINIHAHKIYPGDVEEKIVRFSNITECIIVKGNSQQGVDILECLYVADDLITREDLKILEDVLATYEIPGNYIKVNTLPKNINGKIDRTRYLLI